MLQIHPKNKVIISTYHILTTNLLYNNKIISGVDFTEPSTPVVPKTPSIPLDDATKKKLKKDNKLA